MNCHDLRYEPSMLIVPGATLYLSACKILIPLPPSRIWTRGRLIRTGLEVLIVPSRCIAICQYIHRIAFL